MAKRKPGRKVKNKNETPHDRWMENLADTPAWERRLLDGVVFEDVNRVLKVMIDTTRMQICSERGAKDREGSFRMALATENKILIGMKETAFGDDPGLFKAETHGMLAGPRLSHRTGQTWHGKVNKGMCLFCDDV